MNRYKKLDSNTVIFAIGTFSSKFLIFLMLPLYTRTLSNAEYGEVDLVVQACNLMIPVVSAGIINAVIRFGLDADANKKGVFSFSLTTCLLGFIFLFLAKPLLMKIGFLSASMQYVYLYVFASVLHSICSEFIRSQEHVRLYAFDGIFRTVITITLNVIFLAVLHLGISGYLLATILSDAISAVFLFFSAKLYCFFSLKSIDKDTAGSMLKYALPLIPATISVWIISLSDRYILSYLIGNDANGLYAIAYKVPTIVTVMTTIFMDAWQISSVNEYNKKDSTHFFSRVFGVYSSVVFTVSSAIIAFTKLITGILVSADFYSSWQYMPILIMSTVFSCFSAFLGTIYMSEKKSGHILLTTVISAIINIILNFIMIPLLGIQGAGISTLLSYFAMFLIRAVHSRSFIKMNLGVGKLSINTTILLVQIAVILIGNHNWPLYELILVVIVFSFNLKTLLTGVKKIVKL